MSVSRSTGDRRVIGRTFEETDRPPIAASPAASVPSSGLPDGASAAEGVLHKRCNQSANSATRALDNSSLPDVAAPGRCAGALQFHYGGIATHSFLADLSRFYYYQQDQILGPVFS